MGQDRHVRRTGYSVGGVVSHARWSTKSPQLTRGQPSSLTLAQLACPSPGDNLYRFTCYVVEYDTPQGWLTSVP
jgi:hypothetical protein